MNTPDVPLEKLVAVYLKMRTAIEEKEDEHKKAIASLKEEFEVVANKLLSVCQELGVDSLKTPAGTVSKRTATRYWTNDWESMYQFIKEHDAPYLLEQRLHNGNMRTFLEDNPETMPVGLQADHKYTVQVRRPSAK
jgi:hypothetical protein